MNRLLISCRGAAGVPGANKPALTRVLLSVLVILLSPALTQAQSDSVFQYKEAMRTGDKLSVTNLRLMEIVGKSKTVPKKVRAFKNLEQLSLRPLAVSFGRPRGGGPCIIRYANSTITKLPDWLNEFSKLRVLDLIGVNDIDFVAEMKKLQQLPSLRTLSIDPDKCDDEFVDVLMHFHHLDTLKIRAQLTDQQFDRLVKALPNTRITAGIYADY